MRKIERSTNFNRIFQVFEIDDKGGETALSTFRVRTRVKIGGRWTTRVSTFASLQQAKIHSVNLNVAPQAPVKSMNFEDLFSRFMSHKENETKCAPGTIQGYWVRSRHFRFFAGEVVQKINTAMIDGWTGLLLDPKYKANSSRSRKDYGHELVLLTAVLRHYREFYDEAYLVPILKRHRLRLCARKQTAPVRYLSHQEESDFLAVLSAAPVFQDIALIQLHTGMRVGEAAALQFSDLDLKSRKVTISQHLHWERFSGGKTVALEGTKAGPSRVIDLTPECLDLFAQRKAASASNRVFTQVNQDWLSYRSIQHAFGRAFRQIGSRHTGTHTLRHTFAVRFLDQTKDIYALQKILGHQALEQTQVYAKYADASVTRSFRQFRGGAASTFQSSFQNEDLIDKT